MNGPHDFAVYQSNVQSVPMRCEIGGWLPAMKLWAGVTDKDWYEYLALQRPDEVNFWQPSGTRTFKVLQPGEPFLFKLHSPDNFIVGGGFFVRYSALPASLAWDAFARKNG